VCKSFVIAVTKKIRCVIALYRLFRYAYINSMNLDYCQCSCKCIKSKLKDLLWCDILFSICIYSISVWSGKSSV